MFKTTKRFATPREQLKFIFGDEGHCCVMYQDPYSRREEATYEGMIILVIWWRRPQNWRLSQEIESTHHQDQRCDCSRKQRCLATIGTVRLDNPILLQQQLGSFLFAQSTHCFKLPLSFGPQKLKALALLDSRTSVYVLDKEFAKHHKVPLVQTSKSIHVEVIDGRPLLSSSVTHEFESIAVTFKDHSSYIIFNIIRIPSNPLSLVFPG